MKLLIQRVTYAKLSIDNKLVSHINEGFLVLIGIKSGDTEKDVSYLAEKLVNLRVFEDENGKMNLSLIQTGGEALLVSQFTLYASTKKGNRPSFTDAAPPSEAIPLYEKFISLVKEKISDNKVQTGVFGADMKIELLNNGPVTIELCSDNI